MSAPLCKDCLHFVEYSQADYWASHECSAVRSSAWVEPVTDDRGDDRYCLWEDCAHLGGGNWTRIDEPTPTVSQDRAVEAVAQALYEADDPGHKAWPWPDLQESQAKPDQYRDLARAAIEALAAFKKSEVGHG